MISRSKLVVDHSNQTIQGSDKGQKFDEFKKYNI